MNVIIFTHSLVNTVPGYVGKHQAAPGKLAVYPSNSILPEKFSL
ncbi:hypothetical protein [Nitrosomonas sp.]|nr:hypothetical protein [Nitrosomonas sp.]